MKKHILTIGILMGASLVNTSLAKDDMKIVTMIPVSDLQIKALENLKFLLSADNLQKKSSILIKDEKGTIIYSQMTSDETTFTKVFDLSNLPDGEYAFEVINGNEKISKPFEISTKTKRTALPK